MSQMIGSSNCTCIQAFIGVIAQCTFLPKFPSSNGTNTHLHSHAYTRICAYAYTHTHTFKYVHVYEHTYITLVSHSHLQTLPDRGNGPTKTKTGPLTDQCTVHSNKYIQAHSHHGHRYMYVLSEKHSYMSPHKTSRHTYLYKQKRTLSCHTFTARNFSEDPYKISLTQGYIATHTYKHISTNSYAGKHNTYLNTHTPVDEHFRLHPESLSATLIQYRQRIPHKHTYHHRHIYTHTLKLSHIH